MSLTVYEGYRLRAGVSLDKFLQETGATARASIEVVLQRRIQELAKTLEDKDLEVFIKDGHSNHNGRLLAAYSILRRQYKDQAGRCDLSNFDAGLSFWYLGRSIYMIPHHNPLATPKLWSFLHEDHRLDEYSYWNNADRPDEVSSRVWNQRGRIWKQIFSRSWGWETRLQFFVCETATFTLMLNPLKGLLESQPKK